MQTAASVGSVRYAKWILQSGRRPVAEHAVGRGYARPSLLCSSDIQTLSQHNIPAAHTACTVSTFRPAAEHARWLPHIEVPFHRTRWDSRQLKASNVSSAVAAALTQKQPALARRYLSRDCLDKVKSLLPETLGSTLACASFTTRSIRCPCGPKSILSTAKSSRTARQSHRTRASISRKGTEPPSQAALRVTHSPQLPMTIASNRYYACRRKAAAAGCDPIA